MRANSWSVIRNALPLILIALGANAAELRPVEPTAELVEAGRRIYQEGVLPDGKPLVALRAGGVTLTGDLAACANCHRRSGYGQVEGKSDVSSLAGNVLFAPGRFFGKAPPQGKAAPGMKVVASGRDIRPAYDSPALVRALREGADPLGRRFGDLMPRYELDEPAAKALDAYLRQLSVAVPPGVTADALHLATVIAPGMAGARRQAVVDILELRAKQYRTGRRWILHVWDLEGAPETWESQLDRKYKTQPVFAVLSGLGGAEWMPVHRFCERSKLPCILPNLELAPAVEGDFYSLYFSRGLTLEADALAAYLRELGESDRPRRVVQTYADPAGERAAASLGEALADAIPVETRRYDETAPLSLLKELAAGDALVLWLRPEHVSGLAAVAPDELPVSSLYVSATLTPPEEARPPEAWRPLTRFVTVFDDPARQRGQASMALMPWLKAAGKALSDFRLQADTYAASFFFANALARTRGPTNREWLMETLERIETNPAAAGYPLLSLGPGQRHAVKSAGILRYRPPRFDELQPFGRRIIP